MRERSAKLYCEKWYIFFSCLIIHIYWYIYTYIDSTERRKWPPLHASSPRSEESEISPAAKTAVYVYNRETGISFRQHTRWMKKNSVFSYTLKNRSLILVKQTEIVLHLRFSDWFRTKRNSIWSTNIFKILLNQTKIRLYLPFSDCFGTTNGNPFGSKSIGKW